MTAEEKVAEFTRTIRARNRRELVAGAAVLAFFGFVAFRAMPGSAEFYGALAVVLGTATALAFLLSLCGVRGDLREHPPTDLDRWQGEYRRHARLLRLAPLWGELPLLPGVVILVCAPSGGRTDLLVLALAVITFIFGLVAWLNLRGARRLEEQAEDLGTS
ncbi:MAG: hypothetical protein ACYS9X_17300 [Planctomycetota bacterium]